jgi:TonB family protein
MFPFTKSYIRPSRVLLFAYLACGVLFGPIAAGQEPGRDVEDLAKHISKQIARAGMRSVVVADFVTPDGSRSMQGQYLADEFSERLERHQNSFTVADRKRLSSALRDTRLSANDLAATDSLQRIGNSLEAEAMVTGTVETAVAQYLVGVTVRRVKDGSVVAFGDQRVKRPASVDSMVLLDPNGPGPRIAKAGVNGIGIPACLYCPPPEYTDKARAEKLQANVILLVVINEGGRAGKIVVTKAGDDGLARRAIDAVRDWKFKPATDQQGKAVAVIVPIEVMFRLY